MTILGDASAAHYSFHLIRFDDQWLIGRPLLSAPGIRKLGDEEALSLRERLNPDQVDLTPEAQASLAAHNETISGAADRSVEKADQIYKLMQQFRDEVIRVAQSMPEDPVYAVFTDGKGKVVGKLYQSGGMWFDGNEVWRVGGNAGIQRISEQAWGQTKDPKQARQWMFEQYSTLLKGSNQASVTLTGLPEIPQTPFKADAPLLAIMDKIAAIDPEFAKRFDDWRPDVTPAAPQILILSADISGMKEQARKTLARVQTIEEARKLVDPRSDSEAFWAKFRALMEKVGAASKRLVNAMMQVTPFAVIRDANGKELGRIDQSGGVAIHENKNAGLLLLIKDLAKDADNKYGRFDAFARGLGGGLTIARTGIDVDPQTLFPELRKAVQAARDELTTLTDDWRAKIERYDAAMAVAMEWQA